MSKIKFNREKSEIMDFIYSFVELGINKDGKKDEILKKVIDETYTDVVSEYRKIIKENYPRIYQFVGEDFNILFDMYKWSEVETLADYMNFLKESSAEDVRESLRVSYKIEYKIEGDLTPAAVSKLELSDGSKWKLLYVYTSYDDLKEDLVNDLQGAYEEYENYKNIILTRYKDKIQTLIKRIEDENYAELLTEYIGKDFSEVDYKEFVISLFSYNVTMLWIEEEPLISFGLYTLEYLEELERSKTSSNEEKEQVLKALSDTTRYNILKSITTGVNSNKALSQMYDISPAAVTYQLNALQDSNIIKYDKSAKKYDVNGELIKDVFNTVRIDLSLEW